MLPQRRQPRNGAPRQPCGSLTPAAARRYSVGMSGPPPQTAAADGRPLPPVDWTRIAAWTEAAAAGDLQAISPIFMSHGAGAPLLVWNPAPDQMATEPLRHLLGHWRSLADGARLPGAAQVDPFDLRPALGYVMLLDVLAGGEDFRYRLYGSAISSVSGFDMTGRVVSELPASPYVREFSIAVGRAAVRRREPVYTARHPVGAEDTNVWERLALPLGDADGRVVRLLVGAAPIGRDGQLIRAIY